jgi:O-antigen/teichoic acid export membrane protein
MEVTVTRRSSSGRWSALWGLGMLAIFFGERMIGAGTSRGVATILGLVMVFAAMGVRAARARSAAPDRAQVERTLLGFYALGLGAVVLYFVQSDLPTVLWAGKPLEHGWPRLATVLGALWPPIWLAAASPIALIELAYAQVARAPRIEVGRVRDAMFTGLGLAAALVFAFSMAYVASERQEDRSRLFPDHPPR